MTTKQQQLQQLVRNQQIRELSSSDEQSRQQLYSKNQSRKPIRDPFSQESIQSDSDFDAQKTHLTPFPPKQPKPISLLKQAQQNLKWNYNQEIQNQILAKLEGQGMKDKKIRELASKLKNLNLAYEKEKTMRKNLETQLNSTIKLNQSAKRQSVQKQGRQKSAEKTPKSNQKCTQCSQNDKKIMQMRLKNQNLKTQLNKALRVIARQIGQNFNIDQVLNEQNAWKGRQQKIQKLKGRLKDLQQKLQSNGINVSHMSGFTQMTTNNKTNLGFNSTAQRTSALAENKRKQLDNLKVQVDALKSQNQLLQGKVRSLTSRKLILQNQMKQIKSQFEKKKELFSEKSQNDDNFITLLKNENEKLKKNQKVITKVIYKDDNKEQIEKLKKEIMALREKTKINNQQRPSSKRQIKALNNSSLNRQVSVEKKKNIEQQYLNSDKYLKKLSSKDQDEIYRTWKQSKNKF